MEKPLTCKHHPLSFNSLSNLIAARCSRSLTHGGTPSPWFLTPPPLAAPAADAAVQGDSEGMNHRHPASPSAAARVPGPSWGF